MRPETAAEKKARLVAAANSKETKKAPVCIKSGLEEVVSMIEKKQAKLVVIAHDVDPIELVVFLPVLCKKMEVPYCIVKGKARLGALVHKKTCAVVAVDKINKEDQPALEQLIQNIA